MKQSPIVYLDRIMAFSICALIYFLPISSAMVEGFFSIGLFAFFAKRGMLAARELKNISNSTENNFLQRKFQVFLFLFKPKESQCTALINFYIFLNFLSIFNSLNPASSLKGFFFKVLQETFTYFIFIESINSVKRFKCFLTAFFVSIVLIMSDGIFQFIAKHDFIYGHKLLDYRLTASFRHGNDFGGYLVFIVPVLAALSFLLIRKRESLFWKNGLKFLSEKISLQSFQYVMVFMFIAGLALVGLTLSRGAWLALSVSMLLLCVRNYKFLFFFLLSGVIFLAVFYPLILKERSLLSLFADSGRMAYWKEAWQIIKDYPILGSGVNTYSEIGKEYKITWGGYPHNCFLQLTSELGILGLGSFLLIVIAVLIHGIGQLKKISDPFLSSLLVGSLAGLIGYLIHSAFDTSFYSVQLGSYLWLILGFIMTIPLINKEMRHYAK